MSVTGRFAPGPAGHLGPIFPVRHQKTKGHAGITPHGLRDCLPRPSQRFHLGASVRVGVPVLGVMELPTVQAKKHASTNLSASNSVFSNLQGGRLDRLAGWLGRELHRLFRESIYSAAGFSSRLVHDRHFDEAWNDELAGFIQLLIAYSRHLLDDGLYVSLGNLRSLCNCLNQLILGHLGHDRFLVEAQNNLKRMSNAVGVTLFKTRQSHAARFSFMPMIMKSPGLKPIESQNARSSSACVPYPASTHLRFPLVEPSPKSPLRT